jgi:hypothetical protein
MPPEGKRSGEARPLVANVFSVRSDPRNKVDVADPWPGPSPAALSAAAAAAAAAPSSSITPAAPPATLAPAAAALGPPLGLAGPSAAAVGERTDGGEGGRGRGAGARATTDEAAAYDEEQEALLLGKVMLSDAYRRRQEAIEVRHRQLQQQSSLTSFL